jgi:AraC-like DNA-binding protein
MNRMSGKLMLANELLNSLDLVYINSGMTTINVRQDEKWLQNTFDQPFAVITQITHGRIVVHTLDDNVSFELQPGQGMLIPAHVKYTIKLLDDHFTSHWLNMNFSVFEHFSIFDLMEAPYFTNAAHGTRIGQLQAAIMATMKDDHLDIESSLSTMARLKQHLFEVMEIILSISRLNMDRLEQIRSYERFQPVMAYIDKHLNEKVKVSRLAELMHLSTSHFYRQFKDAFQTSPLHYIQTRRLKKAQYLLATTDMTISEIASVLGYDNAYPFIRFFKTMYGSSPGKYKKTIMSSLSSNRSE